MNASVARRGIAVGAVSAAIIVAGSTAQAVYWGPLRSSYDGTQRVYADGDFYNETYVYATNKVYLNDTANDGNNVYSSTAYYYYYSGSWHYDRTLSTGEYTYSNTPVVKYLKDGLSGAGTSARGRVVACAQLAFPVPDSCSGYAYPTFAY